MRNTLVFTHVSCVLLIFLSVASAEEFKASAPDIYPTDVASYVGEVVVTINANQPHAQVYFTRDGTRPTNKSREYTAPFTIFEVGNTIVRAVAIPKTGTIEASAVVQREYVVLPSDVTVPVVSPERGIYRGFVKVSLSSTQENASLQYVIDVDDPGNTWLDYTEPFPLDIPGEHVVICRAIIGKGKDAKKSPQGKYRFVVSPPLVYDVTTECKKCREQPTVGHRFTIWLQNAEAHSRLFLTTSMKGCETERHKLDDTDDAVTMTVARKLSYSFITYTEPVPKVYVCLSEPSNVNKTFNLVLRRAKVNAQGTSDNSFEIFPAFGVVTPHPSSAPKKYYGFSANEQNHATASMTSFLVLGIALLAMFVLVFKLFVSRGHDNHGRRRVPTMDPDS